MFIYLLLLGDTIVCIVKAISKEDITALAVWVLIQYKDASIDNPAVEKEWSHGRLICIMGFSAQIRRHLYTVPGHCLSEMSAHYIAWKNTTTDRHLLHIV